MFTSHSRPDATRPPLAIIAGPTASGKSTLAICVAEATGGVIVNADSAQVYRDLAVVSARPVPADEARAPHRLYGTRDGATACSAADWSNDAKKVIAEVHAAGHLPILVGGTGLYLRTLLNGIAPVPAIDADVRMATRVGTTVDNYRALGEADPVAASRLHPADSQRIARALEVVRSTGRTLLDWQSWRHGGIGDEVRVHGTVLLPPRAWLANRCDLRFERIVDAGRDEVEALLARGLDPALPVMNAIGVREIAGLIRGGVTRDEALAAGRAATRAYAKRQYTWFRNQAPADWHRHDAPLDNAGMTVVASRFARAIGTA